MNITKNETDDNITITLEGRLDKLSSPVLDDFLKTEVEKNKNIVFDFQDLEYVSSAGLRILVSCEKQLKDFLCRIGLEYIYCVNFLTDSFDSRVFNDAQKKEIKRMILHSADVLEENLSDTPTIIDMDNKFKERIESLHKEIKARQLPLEFANFFIAPFKGIGPGNINNYEKLEEILTDNSRKRSVIEYAKIALLIYNSKKMSAKKPQTFSEWYQYFCKIVGCEYNKEYKPSKLKDFEGLEKEFAFLL